MGKGRVVRDGADVAVLSLGAHLSECEKAAETLAQEGLNITLADARFAKPLDTELLADLAANHRALITVEQGSQGGFGAQVLHHLANTGALDGGLQIRTITLPDRFIEQAAPNEMYEDAEMTADNIAAIIRGLQRKAANILPLHA